MAARRIKRLLIAALTVFMVGASSFTGMAKVEAASFVETLLYGGIAFAYINGQLNNINDNHQQDMLKQTQQQTGVYENDEKDAYLAQVAERLMHNGLIKGKYAVYMTPSKDFNAFCTLGRVIAVNRGTIELLDEDELAAVLGHEMSHGEHKDPVDGTKKMLGIGLVVDLYLQNNPNTTSGVLSAMAGNYVNNEVITMDEEWNADNSGFDNAVAAGYNPGGGAASMVKLRAKLGDLWHEGLSRTINPNNHPKTSDRIHNFGKRMTDYSYGHVQVKNDATVEVNGVDIVTPVKTSQLLAGERAYLIAGNLARVFHSQQGGKPTEPATVADNGVVYIGQQAIMTPLDEDSSGTEIARLLNQAMTK